MTKVREVAMTSHSDHHYQPSYPLESRESEHIMEDMEYQVDNNDVVYKINVQIHLCHLAIL